MTHRRRLGLLGGTFDPIHYGHLDAAEAARRALRLDDILLIPSHDPPHRPIDPRASTFHRFALAALAIQDRQGYRLSDLELTRSGHSFTHDTLIAMQAEGWESLQLFFILGADAFAEIATWHAYPAVLDAAHFVVIARANRTTHAALAAVPELTDRVCEPGTASLDRGPTRVVLVEAHTRDVSSTTIRARLAAGAAIDDLVPAPVARHILIHQLYTAVNDLHGQNERISQ